MAAAVSFCRPDREQQVRFSQSPFQVNRNACSASAPPVVVTNLPQNHQRIAAALALRFKQATDQMKRSVSVNGPLPSASRSQPVEMAPAAVSPPIRRPVIGGKQGSAFAPRAQGTSGENTPSGKSAPIAAALTPGVWKPLTTGESVSPLELGGAGSSAAPAAPQGRSLQALIDLYGAHNPDKPVPAWLRQAAVQETQRSAEAPVRVAAPTLALPERVLKKLEREMPIPAGFAEARAQLLVNEGKLNPCATRLLRNAYPYLFRGSHEPRTEQVGSSVRAARH